MLSGDNDLCYKLSARQTNCHGGGHEMTAQAQAQAPQASFLATRRGKLTLALLAAVAFPDFVDASIVTIALPSSRRKLNSSEQGPQWVPTEYRLPSGASILLE